MQEKNEVDIPVRYIKGVGPKRSSLFEKLGIISVSDLFYYLPRRYEDRSKVAEIGSLGPGDESSVIGDIEKTAVFKARTGTNITEIVINDGTGRIYAVWYNMPFMIKNFKSGQKVLLYGKVELYNRLQITHPVYEILDDEANRESLEVGRIVPVYPVTQDLSQKYMRKTVHNAISRYLGHLPEVLPTYIRARRKLVDAKFAIGNIHFPHSMENLQRAYRRLVFEEFFILQVIMALKRKKQAKKGISHKIREGLLSDFQDLFDFELTEDQKRCIRDIENDMARGIPMNRLLQGDVGSGKTVVAMYALLMAVHSGYQAVMMAPTEILARQHYVTVSQTLMPLGLNIRLLVNGLDDSTKDAVKKEISEGNADIILGTHSVFQENVNYDNLGLVIIDEQHKFGVDQRKSLRDKNIEADTLVMTATPIPRSLVLTVYGDMDISVLKSKPSGRGPVATYWVGEDKRAEVYRFIGEQLDDGRQAFVVCPRIKKGDKTSLASAEEMFEKLSKDIFRRYRVALIHGGKKTEENDKVMRKFGKGEYDILVTTTIVEVGVDIPNATVMLVEQADRYGLAQLHQLRGRIGRGKDMASYCVLMGEPSTEGGKERLNAISTMDDGFQISEKDLDLRGPGEFFGTRQSGLPELKFGDIIRDFKIMEEARIEAFCVIDNDAQLQDQRHLWIKKSIIERFKGKALGKG